MRQEQLPMPRAADPLASPVAAAGDGHGPGGGSHPASPRPPAASARWRAAWLALALVVLTIHVGVTVHRRATHAGDFDVSREFGRRLVAGEPLYAGGLHYPYMPAAALYFAPLALLPAGVAFALRYAVALACLWFTLDRLHALLRGRWPRLAGQRLAVAATTLVLAAHYVVRDLDDAGQHLILLAMLVAGISCVGRERTAAGAIWFGLAAALKAPNAVLLPYLAWKRQWRLAVLTALALAAWSALPAVWMGSAAWARHQRQWIATALASAAGMPSGGARVSEERPQNQALRPVVARLARAVLPPAAARLAPAVAGAAAVALVALVAWWTRRPTPAADAPSWLAETSAVLILSLLLSPVTWVQHLVLLVPALYLIAAVYHAGGGLSRAAAAAMLAYAMLSLLLNRELLGRAVYLQLLAGGLHTVCMLLVLAVLAAVARPRAAGG